MGKSGQNYVALSALQGRRTDRRQVDRSGRTGARIERPLENLKECIVNEEEYGKESDIFR